MTRTIISALLVTMWCLATSLLSLVYSPLTGAATARQMDDSVESYAVAKFIRDGQLQHLMLWGLFILLILIWSKPILTWLDIHPNGGRYGSDLAKLRADGVIDGCELTEAGRGCVRESLETGIAGALQPLDGTQRTIIDQLKNGEVYDREGLAKQLGIHPNGGRYGSDLARLRTMGLIPERGQIRLTEAAFA